MKDRTERRVDRGLRSWAARLANRKDTSKVLAAIVAMGLIVIAGLCVVAFVAGRASVTCGI